MDPYDFESLGKELDNIAEETHQVVKELEEKRDESRQEVRERIVKLLESSNRPRATYRKCKEQLGLYPKVVGHENRKKWRQHRKGWKAIQRSKGVDEALCAMFTQIKI
jgi:hypothetical protein